MRAVWWTWGLFHKLTDFSQKWSWLGGGDESCRWDINNHNIVATLILERLRDPKNVIVSQGYDHFFWNWCCADFCGCCSHWFFSLNGTTSMGKKKKKKPGFSQNAQRKHSAKYHSRLFLSIFSIPGTMSLGKMKVSLTTNVKRWVDSVLLSWDDEMFSKWQRNQNHFKHGESQMLVENQIRSNKHQNYMLLKKKSCSLKKNGEYNC